MLVMGEDLKEFLKNMREDRKTELKENEFFCFSCKKNVQARAGTEQIIKTGKTIGKNHADQLKKIGVCEICSKGVGRFLKVYKKD